MVEIAGDDEACEWGLNLESAESGGEEVVPGGEPFDFETVEFGETGFVLGEVAIAFGGGLVNCGSRFLAFGEQIAIVKEREGLALRDEIACPD